MTLLIVTDNEHLAKYLNVLLAPHGLCVEITADRDNVKHALHRQDVVAILLDFPDPSLVDFEYWRDLQKMTALPILTVSTDNTDAQRILCYLNASVQVAVPITKFVQQLAVAAQQEEVRAMPHRDQIRLGPEVFLDVAGHCIVKRGERTPLSSNEFKLLYVLASRSGLPLTTQDLMDLAELTGISALYVHIKNLREKLEDDPACPKVLLTRRGQGYAISVPDPGPSPVPTS